MWKVVYDYNHIVFFTFIKVEQEEIYYNLDAKCHIDKIQTVILVNFIFIQTPTKKF